MEDRILSSADVLDNLQSCINHIVTISTRMSCSEEASCELDLENGAGHLSVTAEMLGLPEAVDDLAHQMCRIDRCQAVVQGFFTGNRMIVINLRVTEDQPSSADSGQPASPALSGDRDVGRRDRRTASNEFLRSCKKTGFIRHLAARDSRSLIRRMPLGPLKS